MSAEEYIVLEGDEWDSFTGARQRPRPRHGQSSPEDLRLMQKLRESARNKKLMKQSDLSPDQRVAYDSIVHWLSDPNRRQWFSFGGYAGTGKTTVTAVLAKVFQEEGIRTAFCAFTGKAASVLGNKLPSDCELFTCSTMHRLMYEPRTHGQESVSWVRREALGCDLVVVDEASMVPQDIWNDLLKYKVPILLVGDHGQLPPVGANPNLMEKPDARLDQIHRQAEGNPILALANFVRNGGDPRKFRQTDERVKSLDNFIDGANTIGLGHVGICFTNGTRVLMNEVVRDAKGMQKELSEGDIVICLKNKAPIYNGMRALVEGRKGSLLWLYFPEEGIRATVDVCPQQFGAPKTFQKLDEIPGTPYRTWDDAGSLYDYGYVMTCHKMQGSQAREVTVMVEKWLGKTQDAARRWLYTAVTRASEQLNLVFE